MVREKEKQKRGARGARIYTKRKQEEKRRVPHWALQMSQETADRTRADAGLTSLDSAQLHLRASTMNEPLCMLSMWGRQIAATPQRTIVGLAFGPNGRLENGVGPMALWLSWDVALRPRPRLLKKRTVSCDG